MSTKKRRKVVSKRMSLQRKRRMTFLFLLVVACAVFVFAGSYFALRNYVKKVDEKVICDNVFIGTEDVSAMTAKEAKAALKKHLEQDKSVTLTMKVNDQTATATLEELGLHSDDVDGLVKKAVDYGKKGTMWKRYRQMKKLEKEPLVLAETFVLDEKASKAVLKERAVPLEQGAVDATITKTATGFSVTSEKEGKTIHLKKSIEKITEYLNGKWEHKDFSMKMVSRTDKPEVTKENLETIQDELGTFSTDAGGGERWQNLKTGVDMLNGIVLMPDEEISVYNTTAPYDEEHGYVQAGAYENGQVVDAYGGGICQVSTTLYNAVIYAELEIVERYPHSMTVAYVDPSRDAAIAGDYMDFKFKNPYKTPVLIFAQIDDANQLRFTIYGQETRPAGRTIEFESETLSTEDYGVTYKENPEANIGSMQYTGNPHTGKEARLWKIVYEDGKEVSRDIFNNSSYAKSDEIIEVGTASSSSEATALVRNAINTQNESAILEAISKAGAMSSGSSNHQDTEGNGGERDENTQSSDSSGNSTEN